MHSAYRTVCRVHCTLPAAHSVPMCTAHSTQWRFTGCALCDVLFADCHECPGPKHHPAHHGPRKNEQKEGKEWEQRGMGEETRKDEGNGGEWRKRKEMSKPLDTPLLHLFPKQGPANWCCSRVPPTPVGCHSQHQALGHQAQALQSLETSPCFVLISPGLPSSAPAILVSKPQVELPALGFELECAQRWIVQEGTSMVHARYGGYHGDSGGSPFVEQDSRF